MKTAHKKVLLALEWSGHMQLQAIYRYACEKRWMLSRWVPGPQHFVQRFKPDGIICQMHGGKRQMLADVRVAGVPMVELFGHKRSLPMPVVLPDSVAAGALSAQHLIARGFRRLIYVGNQHQVHKLNYSFYEGLKRVAEEAHCELQSVFLDDPDLQRATGENHLHSDVIHSENSPRMQKWAGKFFARFPKPFGMHVDQPIRACDIIEGCLDAGIRIPEEMGVVTVINEPHDGSMFTVPATCVLMDTEEQAYQAAALLDRMMHGEKVAADTAVFVPPRLIERESTQVYAVDDMDVSRATRFIMEHLHDPNLYASGVVEQTGVPPRSLYRTFKAHMGMPIGDYIEHLRIKETTHLLASTDKTASAIATECGFSTLKQFRRALTRHTSLTPRAYRDRHRRTRA